MNKEISFAGLTFKGLSIQSILSSTETFKHIVTVNAEYIVRAQKNHKLKEIICNNYSTFDGQVPFILAKIKNYNKNFEKISGSDFIYVACHYAKKNNKKVFLLGGQKSSNLKSVEILREKFQLDIEGFSPDFSPYPFEKQHNDKIIHQIKRAMPQILFVGFGAVKQDSWIDDNKEILKNIGVEIAIGSGGTFEFVSGELKRAPRWIQKIGMEGIYRLIKEPKKFRIKRLLVSFKIFKYACK